MLIWEVISFGLPVNMCLILPNLIFHVLLCSWLFSLLCHHVGRHSCLWLLLMSFGAIVSGFLKLIISGLIESLLSLIMVHFSECCFLIIFSDCFFAVAGSLKSCHLKLWLFLPSFLMAPSLISVLFWIALAQSSQRWKDIREREELIVSLIVMKLPFVSLH